MSAKGYFGDSDHEFINWIVMLCQNNIILPGSLIDIFVLLDDMYETRR